MATARTGAPTGASATRPCSRASRPSDFHSWGPSIPKAYKQALQKAGQTYIEYHPALKGQRLVVRNVDDTTVGVWRLSDKA